MLEEIKENLAMCPKPKQNPIDSFKIIQEEFWEDRKRMIQAYFKAPEPS